MIYVDRVQETTTTTGTGALALGGAVAAFRSFSAALTDGDEVTYCVAGASEWEVGRGTFTAPSTLSRAEVYSSSNGGNAVNFSAGSKRVFVTQAAESVTDAAALAAAAARIDALETITGGGLSLGGADGGLVTGGRLVAFSSLLAFDDHKRMVFAGDGTEACVLALDAAGGHAEGAQIAVFIPAGEAGSLVVANELRNRDGDNLATFDPALDYWLLATYTGGRVVATGQSLSGQDVTAPTLTTATIDSGTPSQLVLALSEPALLPALDGLSLTFNVGTARTISSVVSGNGTNAITLGLSGDVAEGDEVDLVVGSGRRLQDLSGNLIATGTTAVTLAGFGGPAFAFGSELHIWDATSMTTSTGAVDVVDDQIGTADVVPGATRPTVTTIGSLAAPAWLFVDNSHLAVDITETAMTAGYLACIVDLATLDFSNGTLISGGVTGSLTTISEILWKVTGPQRLQAFFANQGFSMAANHTSAGVVDIVVTWGAAERAVYINGTLAYTLAGFTGTANVGRWVLGDAPNKGGTFDVPGVKMHDARVGAALLNATAAADYHAHRLATVGT